MRSAIGLIAGPLSLAVRFEMRGFRSSASIAIATKVLTRDTASAPAFSAALAITGMLVTLGESFTISGRRAADLQLETSSSRSRRSLPKVIPPCLVLGQETFN